MFKICSIYYSGVIGYTVDSIQQIYIDLRDLKRHKKCVTRWAITADCTTFECDLISLEKGHRVFVFVRTSVRPTSCDYTKAASNRTYSKHVINAPRVINILVNELRLCVRSTFLFTYLKKKNSLSAGRISCASRRRNDMSSL